MLKNILKLEGAQELSKKEQKSITGGIACRTDDSYCPGTSYCCGYRCIISTKICDE